MNAQRGGRSAASLRLETRKPVCGTTDQNLSLVFVPAPGWVANVVPCSAGVVRPALVPAAGSWVGQGSVAAPPGRPPLFDRWRLFYGWWLLLLRAPWLRLFLPDLVRTGRGLLHPFRLSIVPARLLLIAWLLLLVMLPLLILLASRLAAGLVAVMLLMQSLLLLCLLRITLTCVLALVRGQRCPWRNGVTVPAVPALALLFPLWSPVQAPAGRFIMSPAAEVGRRIAVIAHRNAQDEDRQIPGVHRPPWAVVPVAGVPGVVLVDPVQAVVEEVVGCHVGRVVDRVARHHHQLWEQRQVDADADVGQADTDADVNLGRDAGCRQADRQPECDHNTA